MNRQMRLLSNKDVRSALTIALTFMFALSNVLIIIINNLLETHSVFIKIAFQFDILFSIIIFCFHLVKNYVFDKETYATLLWLIYSIGMFMINIALGGKSVDIISQNGAFLATLGFPLFLYVFAYNIFTKRMIDALLAINVICSILFIVLFFSDKAYKYGDGTLPYLTLNYSNSNLTGIVLLGNFGVLLVTLLRAKNIFVSIFIAIVSAMVFYFLYLTKSRMIFFIAVLLVLCLLFKFRVNKWVLLAVMVSPLVFSVLYNLLYMIEPLRGLTILGKPFFSGRLAVWQEHLATLKDNPVYYLFGNMKEAQLKNAHNGAIAILCNYGIIGSIIFFATIYLNSKQQFSLSNTRCSNMAKWVVLGMYLTTISEAAMFLFTAYFAIYYVICLIIISSERAMLSDNKLSNTL